MRGVLQNAQQTTFDRHERRGTHNVVVVVHGGRGGGGRGGRGGGGGGGRIHLHLLFQIGGQIRMQQPQCGQQRLQPGYSRYMLDIAVERVYKKRREYCVDHHQYETI